MLIAARATLPLKCQVGPTNPTSSKVLRLTEPQLRRDLATNPSAKLLTWRDSLTDPILGTVWLDPGSAGTWNLGLLTIHPVLQNRQLGRTLLAAAEDFARQSGAHSIRLTVVNVRETLIAWYERRGYQRTSETAPFPYNDEKFGRPPRDDLHFIVLAKDL